MSSLHISALDTLFFKDGKPFSMGEETWANGVFPPFPSVFYGGLRSIWFAQASNLALIANATNDRSQTNDQSLNLQITGLLPTINGELFFPAPNDLYGIKRGPENEAHKLKCIPKPGELITDYHHECLLQTKEITKVEELGGKALLCRHSFETYLQNTCDNFQVTRLSEYVLSEPKVGIGRNQNTRTTEPGQLYRVAMRRLHSIVKDGGGKPFGFALQYKGLDLPPTGLSRFGAEIKAIEYEAYSGDWNIPCPVQQGEPCFKIYLATPAVFEEGFYPKTWFDINGLTLLTAAFGRVQHIGGFDMKEVRPKPMRKAVPAGTVYYVRAANGFSQPLKEALHSGSVYNLGPADDTIKKEFQPQGFGFSYVGNFNIEKNI
jgi:CRISPR-associated protein Cmr3